MFRRNETKFNDCYGLFKNRPIIEIMDNKKKEEIDFFFEFVRSLHQLLQRTKVVPSQKIYK